MANLDINKALTQAQKNTISNMNLSNVTNASRATNVPANTNNLSIAGQVTPNALQQAAASGQLGPVNINPSGGISPRSTPVTQTVASGGGPGGIARGSYDARSLSQDQRQWLWEQFGHRGQAPVGYGGERTQEETPAALPPSTPPVTPPAQFTVAPPSGLSLATTPAAISSASLKTQTGSAPATQTSPKQLNATAPTPTLAQQAIQGLQTVARPISQGAQKLVKGGQNLVQGEVSDFLKAVQNPNNPPALENTSLGSAMGEYYGGLGGAELTSGVLGKAGEILGQIPKIGEGLPKLATAATSAIGGLLAAPGGSKADINIGTKGPGAITTSKLKDGTITKTPITNPTASKTNLMGTIPAEQHPQAIQAYLSGKNSVSDVASSIASPEAQKTINNMISTAVKSGDMGTVGRLADLQAAVTTQLNFINQIGQIVSALAAGFGTQNAPGVTAARTPMAETGIGQELTANPPVQSFQTPQFQGAEGQAQMLVPPFQEQTSPVQNTLKPNLTPVTGTMA